MFNYKKTNFWEQQLLLLAEIFSQFQTFHALGALVHAFNFLLTR